jgi:hypothetical protein
VRSSSGTPMAVWQPRQARLPGLTPDEVREHMSPRLRDLDSRRNRGPHTGSAVRIHDGKDLLAEVQARS